MDKNHVRSQNIDNLVFDYDFKDSLDGWVGGFADLPIDSEEAYELVFEHKDLPAYLGENQKAIFISGNNHSDDLFMFIKRQLTGLKSNTTYRVQFYIRVATDAPSGCRGVGGSPGESVFLKAGGATEEPLTVVKEGYYRMKIDKGNQSEGGKNALVLGDVANSSKDCLHRKYEFKDFHLKEKPFEITTDAGGIMWIIIGTDSGYEATTAIYYSHVTITATESISPLVETEGYD